MTKPRLLIHIGTHKTGTTTIQRALNEQRAALLAEGIFYPPTDREPWPELPKHCSVFSAATKSDASCAEAERRLLLSQFVASGAHTLVISEEGLSEPLPHLPRFFAPMAADFQIHVVCFLRRPDLFTESLYNQFVREAARREARSILMFSRARGLRDRLEYATILSRWQDLPGARLTVLDFDGAVAERPLLQVFATAAELPPLRAPQERVNGSPDVRLIQVLARLNRQRATYNLPRLMQAAKALEAEGRFPRIRYMLGHQERSRLLEELQPGLSRLAVERGVQFSNQLPPGEAAPCCEDVDTAYTMELLARLS